MKQIIAETTQKALNKLLALDPESKSRLLKLQDKIVTLELLGTGLCLQLVFHEGKILVKSDNFLPPHTTIKGTPLTLLRMTFEDNRKQFFADDVSIEGNLDLGQHVIDLFDQLEIDWEEYLSRCVGDVPAHQVGNFFRELKKFTKKTRRILTQNVNEFVHEEIEMFPPEEELEDFFADVDALRMDVDRLEARVAMLRKKGAAV